MSNDALQERLRAMGQEHLLRFADELSGPARAKLEAQVAGLDFELLAQLWRKSLQASAKLDPAAIAPIDVVRIPRTDAERSAQRAAREAGLEAIGAGKVAALLVAGGQGTRLGFEHPKGMFPIGPVRKTTLFQIFAEAVLAWSRYAGRPIPWCVMTSPTNHAETVGFFEKHAHFGLEPQQVRFFTQGTMPAVDRRTGRVLLADKGEVFASPDGHGGTLTALRASGVLDQLAELGVELISYFQVDNPLVKAIDPVFIGHHLLKGAEASIKVVAKRDWSEKVGVVARYQALPSVIEYSDLPDELAQRTDSAGALKLWAGSIAVHVFGRPFLERITAGKLTLPFHLAIKKVPYVDEGGKHVEPAEPNAPRHVPFQCHCKSNATTRDRCRPDQA